MSVFCHHLVPSHLQEIWVHCNFASIDERLHVEQDKYSMDPEKSNLSQ